MSVYLIEFQAFPRDYGFRPHNHAEVIRDTLEEAIDEIDISKSVDTNFIDMDRVVFDGPFISGNIRYMFTWIKERKNMGDWQCSYIVRELKETPKVKEAMKSGRLNFLIDPL